METFCSKLIAREGNNGFSYIGGPTHASVQELRENGSYRRSNRSF